MEAYLDNSASTKCFEEVKDIMVKTMMDDYGNSSSKHKKGVEAEVYINQAKEAVAKCLKVKEKEIYFTSGGTESNNWALIGGAMANRRAGNHIITTAIEHPAVSQPLMYLEEQGFRITRLPVDEFGLIRIEDLKEAVCEDTIIVSTIHVNNEVGAVEAVEEIGSYLKADYPKVIYHIDAIQSLGKYRIYPKKMGIDLLSASGHKIHAAKGVGLLYVDERVKLHSIMLGGGQQKGMRAGTENVPGVAGFGVAVAKCYEDFDEKIVRLRAQKCMFIEGLKEIERVKMNGPAADEGAPHIISASFLGVRSEVLLHALEDRGIYVSAGSACSSNKKQIGSTTLREMGLTPEAAEGTIRFSLSSHTTDEELEYCLTALKELVPQLRKFSRK
jgi:cysteine desulfurase